MVAESRRYRIVEMLGKGGFGTVYRAELLGAGGFRKPVALKILNADVAGSEDIVSRLRDEARMLGLVRHPCIVHADALVQLDGRWTLVMEHVPGVGLNELLDQGPLPLRCAVEIAGRVADALQAAHTATDEGRPLNLIHRDLKPGNIVLGPAGQVKLLDFGVARAEFDTREAHTQSVILGSAAYMAPERWDQQDLPAGDIFSLGQVLYECLTGDPYGRTLPAPDYYDARLDKALEKVVNQATARAPDELLDLLAVMLAYEPGDRPLARDIEVFCRDIVPRLPGPWLRDWAEQQVPETLAARPPRTGDLLSGSTLVEPSGTMELVTGGMPTEVEPVPPPAPSRPWLVPVAFLVGLLFIVGGGAAALVALMDQLPTTPASILGAPEEQPSTPPESITPAATPPAQAALPSPSTPKPTHSAAVQAAAPAAVPAPAQGQPKPSPRVDVTPEPQEPAPAATGMVVLAGDVDELRLVSAAGRFGPGDVPVGSYEVQARFPGRGLLPVGKVQVQAGQTTTVSCNASFAMCKVSP